MRAIPYLLLAPAVIVILSIFAGGLGMAVVQSFGYLPAAALTELSLSAYGDLFSRPGFLRSVRLTLFVAVASTLFTLLFALITALALRRYRRAVMIRTLYQIPITVPHLVVSIAMLMLISQSGIFSRLLHGIGLIAEQSQFPVLTADRYGVGIIVVYVWKQVPFIGLIALAVLQSIGDDYEELARTLGAGRLQTVRHVLLPLVLPGLVPGSIIIFAFVFGAFEVPLLLGRSYPSMLSVLAYRLYTDADLSARPEAMATSVIIALFILAIVVPYRRLAERK